MAMGMEMVVAVETVMVMKTEAIDDGYDDDSYDSQESNSLLTRSIIFYITPDYSSNTLHLSFTLPSILHYFWGIGKIGPTNKDTMQL